jgi:hypothetical protein
MMALDYELLDAADEMERMIVRLAHDPAYEHEVRDRLKAYVGMTDRAMLMGMLAYVALVTRKDAGVDVMTTLSEQMVELSAAQVVLARNKKGRK